MKRSISTFSTRAFDVLDPSTSVAPMNELPSSNFTEMFVADYFGGSGLAMHDDPTDPNAMSELQRDVSLLARYENQTTIRMRLDPRAAKQII